MTEVMGTVGALRRHPVKSMLGEDLDAAFVTERGVPGDRGLALIDLESGKIASAKNPRLWRALPTFSASVAGSDGGAGGGVGGGGGSVGVVGGGGVAGAVRITAPDGKELWSTDADIDEALSAIVGRDVTLADTPPPGASLVRSKPDLVLAEGLDAEVDADLVVFGSGAPTGTFFDFAPLHLVTTSALRTIAGLSPRGTIEAERYRANVIVETAGKGFVENDWLGKELAIGPELVVKIVARTPRCSVPTLVHGDLPRDLDALRIPAKHNLVSAFEGGDGFACVGVYAQVLRPGRVGVGDVLRM